MENVNWLHFTPRGGGSFGRGDMGDFCEVNHTLFVIPTFEIAITKLSIQEIHMMIKKIADGQTKFDVYELRDGAFSGDLTVNWRDKIKSSLIFPPAATTLN